MQNADIDMHKKWPSRACHIYSRCPNLHDIVHGDYKHSEREAVVPNKVDVTTLTTKVMQELIEEFKKVVLVPAASRFGTGTPLGKE